MGASALHMLKELLGWIYFVAWSATGYPQVLLNIRRRSTMGLSHDFTFMAWIGFVAYSCFTVGGFVSPTIRAAFQRERGTPPPIELADVAFAMHALAMSSVWLGQVLYLAPGPRMRRDVSVFCIGTVVSVLIALNLASHDTISWVRAMEFCGSVKVFTSIVKHFPQAWSNYRRKSTVGFSVTMILLDVVGSLGSFAQQGVRCVIEGSWAPYTGNLSKLALAVESFLFDVFFLYQHYVLYPKREDLDAQYRLAPSKVDSRINVCVR